MNEILIKEKIENLNDRNNSDYKLIQEFLRYTKNVEGKLIRGGEEVQKKYIYFDEREWRYCPTNSELGVNLPHIIHQINFYQENKKIINESASNIKLNFNLNDISYIIVQNEEDIITLINNLKNLNFLNNENATVFSSRIITTKQIKNDF